MVVLFYHSNIKIPFIDDILQYLLKIRRFFDVFFVSYSVTNQWIITKLPHPTTTNQLHEKNTPYYIIKTFLA